MALSKNEKYMGIGVLAVATLFGLDYLALSPYIAQRDAIKDQIKKDQTKLADNKAILAKRERLTQIWNDMQKNGLKLDASIASSQVEVNMDNWITQAGMVADAVHQDRTTQSQENKQFTIISYTYRLTGTMRGLAALLNTLETAPIPIEINSININAPKEGIDQMSTTLVITALCMPPQDTVPPKPATPPANSPT